MRNQWSVVNGLKISSFARNRLSSLFTRNVVFFSLYCLLSTVYCLLSSTHAPSAKPRSASVVDSRANPPGPVIAASADAWPQFRGNYNLTGVSPSELSPTLKLQWTFDAGDIIESSAAIAGNTVYVGTGKSELVAL